MCPHGQSKRNIMFVFVFKSRLSNARNMLTFFRPFHLLPQEKWLEVFCPALGTLPKQLPFCLILPVLRKFEFDFMDVFLCQDFIFLFLLLTICS